VERIAKDGAMMKHQYIYNGKQLAIIETDDILAHVVGTVHTINGRDYQISKVFFEISERMYVVHVYEYK